MTNEINRGDGDYSLVFAALEQTNLSTATAFLTAVTEEVVRSGGLLTSKADILRISERMHREGRLPLNQEIVEALDDAWAQSRYFRCAAYDRDVLAEATDANLYPDAQTYLGIIERRGRENNWTRNLRGRQELDAQRHAQRRQRLIAIIAGGKTTYPLWAKEYGQFRYHDVLSLENESDEMLEALVLRVPEWRAQISGCGPTKVKAQAEEGISLTAPAQNLLVSADDELLVNPATGVEFTANEIKRMGRGEYHRLIFCEGQSRGITRTNAVNRILAGRKYGE